MKPDADPIASLSDQIGPMVQWLGSFLLVAMLISGGFALIKYLYSNGGGSRVVYRDRPIPEAEASQTTQRSIAKTWELACAARDEFVAAYTEFEVGKDALDHQLFKRPLLKDTSEPLTAAWLDAKEDFDTTFPTTQPRTADAAEEALKLARATRDAWRKADKNARDKGIGSLSDADAERLDTVQRLLTAARDRGTSAEERRSQVMKIAQILGDLTHRPQTEIQAQIEKSLNPWLKSIGAPPLRLALEA